MHECLNERRDINERLNVVNVRLLLSLLLMFGAQMRGLRSQFGQVSQNRRSCHRRIVRITILQVDSP
jgi:hypothetical protein